MEATRSTTTGTCPPWCTTDHSALIYPNEPQFGTRKTHIGPGHEVDGTRLHGSRYPGLEPKISIYNYLAGTQLYVSAEEARAVLELVRWLAKGNIRTVRKFASDFGEALAAIEQEQEQDPGDDARGGSGR